MGGRLEANHFCRLIGSKQRWPVLQTSVSECPGFDLPIQYSPHEVKTQWVIFKSHLQNALFCSAAPSLIPVSFRSTLSHTHYFFVSFSCLPDCLSFLSSSFAPTLSLNPALICPRTCLNLPPSFQSYSFSASPLALVSPSPHLISTPFILSSPPSLSSVIALRLSWLHLSWPWRARCPLLSPNLEAATLAAGLNTLAYVLFRWMALHDCDAHTKHTHTHNQVVVSCICIDRHECAWEQCTHMDPHTLTWYTVSRQQHILGIWPNPSNCLITTYWEFTLYMDL